MEWMDGGSVADLLGQEGALIPRRATKVAAAAARALRAVHRAGLVHRDVKPGNLLVSRQGKVKLGDFGLAVEVSAGRRSELDRARGPRAYGPPKRAWPQRLDPRADLYSLGATYFELMPGHKSFRAGTVQDYACLHRDGPVPAPRSIAPVVPAACAAVVR